MYVFYIGVLIERYFEFQEQEVNSLTVAVPYTGRLTLRQYITIKS